MRMHKITISPTPRNEEVHSKATSWVPVSLGSEREEIDKNIRPSESICGNKNQRLRRNSGGACSISSCTSMASINSIFDPRPRTSNDNFGNRAAGPVGGRGSLVVPSRLSYISGPLFSSGLMVSSGRDKEMELPVRGWVNNMSEGNQGQKHVDPRHSNNGSRAGTSHKPVASTPRQSLVTAELPRNNNSDRVLNLSKNSVSIPQGSPPVLEREPELRDPRINRRNQPTFSQVPPVLIPETLPTFNTSFKIPRKISGQGGVPTNQRNSDPIPSTSVGSSFKTNLNITEHKRSCPPQLTEKISEILERTRKTIADADAPVTPKKRRKRSSGSGGSSGGCSTEGSSDRHKNYGGELQPQTSPSVVPVPRVPVINTNTRCSSSPQASTSTAETSSNSNPIPANGTNNGPQIKVQASRGRRHSTNKKSPYSKYAPDVAGKLEKAFRENTGKWNQSDFLKLKMSTNISMTEIKRLYRRNAKTVDSSLNSSNPFDPAPSGDDQYQEEEGITHSQILREATLPSDNVNAGNITKRPKFIKHVSDRVADRAQIEEDVEKVKTFPLEPFWYMLTQFKVKADKLLNNVKELDAMRATIHKESDRLKCLVTMDPFSDEQHELLDKWKEWYLEDKSDDTTLILNYVFPWLLPFMYGRTTVQNGRCLSLIVSIHDLCVYCRKIVKLMKQGLTDNE